MVEIKSLRYLYPLYKRIYVFHTISSHMQWAVIFFIFLQYTFLALYLEKPSAYLTGTSGHNLFHYILSLFYFLPWIFGTHSMNYDSIVIFVFNIISILFILLIAYLCYKNRYVPSNFLIWCRLYPQVIVPLFSLPLIFRISLIIEFLRLDHQKTNIVTFTFYILSLLMFILSQYIASVFLYSFFFYPRSILDFYDGKTHLIFYMIQLIFGMSIMLLPIWRDNSYQGIIFIVYILILGILIFYRIFTVVHVSLVGQYFELSPLFSIPFMFLFHLYGPSHWFYCLILLFFVHIIFIIMINLIRKLLKNAAFRVFDSFLYEDSTVARLPKLVLGNISSFIRLISYYNSDPAVLLRFLENQKQTHLRTSAFIEICRFLCIFPEYRLLTQEEIKNFTSKSSFNRYTLYMFDFLVESATMTTLPDYYMNQLDKLYLSYISHTYFYWNSRKNGNFFRSFFESFTVAFFYSECKKEIKGLFRIFPYAPILHKYYGDMLLNIDGKFDEYKKEILFSNALEKRPDLFMDPLFHLNSLMNPKILQFCNTESQFSFNHSSSSSAMNTISARSENSHFLFSKSSKKEHKSKKSSIASKIIRSKRQIPYLHHFHYIFPPLLLIFFIIYSFPISNEKAKKKNEVNEVTDSIHRSFYSVFSSILAPNALKSLPEEIPNNHKECQSILFSIVVAINQYYSLSPIISYFASTGLIINFHDTNYFVMKSNSVCEILMNFTSNLISNTLYHINFLFEQNTVYNILCDDFKRQNQLMFKYLYFILYGSIAFIIFLFIYFLVACITMNKIMSKNQNAIDFLASDRRLAPIVQSPESREIFWDHLNGFDSSINFSDSSFHLESESDIDPFSTSATQTNLNGSLSANSTYNQAMSNIRSVKSIGPNSIPKIDNSVQQHQQQAASILDNTDVSESGMSEKLLLNRISKLVYSHPNFSGSGINVRRPHRAVNIQSVHTISSDNENDNKNNNDSIITDSAMVDSNLSLETTTANYNNSNNVTSSSNVNIDLQSNTINVDEIEGFGNAISLQKSSGSLSNTPKEIDIKSISSFLDEKKKETCSFVVVTLFIILFPWIIMYVLTILAYYPLKSHRDNVNRVIENAKVAENDFIVSLLLINESFGQLTYGVANISLYNQISNYFTSHETSLSNHFFLEQCFQFNTLECFSVYSIVSQLADQNNNITESFLVNYAIPLFLSFSENGMKELFIFRNIGEITRYLSVGPSFITLVILISIIFIARGILETKEFTKGLNSLFHFPSFEIARIQTDQNHNNNNDENVNSNNAKINVGVNINVNSNVDNQENEQANVTGTVPVPKENEKGPRFPTNVIIITSVTESDEIYSISDTCHQIINKKPSEMICRKLSKVFPIVKTTDGFEIRDHNGKLFISKSIMIGKLSKTALIEASKVEAKNKTTNVIQKLINFMPNYFAKTFSEEFVNYFHFDKSILLFIRIDPNVAQIESLFTIINRLDQAFSDIDFIRSNGSVLTCLCKAPDDLEIILFLRELITSSEESCKKQMKNLALKSVYIDLINELNIDIIEGDIEPEIQFEEKKFLDSEVMTYLVDEHCITISDELMLLIECFTNIVTKVKIILGKTVHVISFKTFSDEIIKNM